MNSFLGELLIDPVSGDPLTVDAGKHQIINSRRDITYEIDQDVPVLLPDKPVNIPQPSPIHADYNTHFDYIDHYKRDAEYFDYFKTRTSAEERHEERRLHETILSNLPSGINTVLDVGCGNGWVAAELCRRDIQVISMDISTRNPIKSLQNTPSKNHAGLVADVYHLPIKSKSIDCVIAAEIIEHTPDPRLFIEQLLKVVKPGGRIIITTPYNETIKYHQCVHCNRPTPSHAHLHSFNENNFDHFLPSSGINWSYQIFSNRYLHKVRSNLFLGKTSHRSWFKTDALVNRLFPQKASRFLIRIDKE